MLTLLNPARGLPTMRGPYTALQLGDRVAPRSPLLCDLRGTVIAVYEKLVRPRSPEAITVRWDPSPGILLSSRPVDAEELVLISRKEQCDAAP